MSMQAQDAEYFGDTRDYWWNLDFLELMGKRLSLDGADEPNDGRSRLPVESPDAATLLNRRGPVS